MNRAKIEEALNKAFQLGKLYEFQAEHEFISYNKKSDETLAEFKALLTSLLAEEGGEVKSILDTAEVIHDYTRNGDRSTSREECITWIAQLIQQASHTAQKGEAL